MLNCTISWIAPTPTHVVGPVLRRAVEDVLAHIRGGRRAEEADLREVDELQRGCEVARHRAEQAVGHAREHRRQALELAADRVELGINAVADDDAALALALLPVDLDHQRALIRADVRCD